MKHIEGNLYLRIAILICVIFLGVVISPFLSTLVVAAILVTGAMPIHEWILKKVKGKQRVAAAITASIIGVVFSAAFVTFIILLSQEGVSTYIEFDTFLQEGKFNLHQLVNRASQYVGVPPSQIVSSITQAAQTLSSLLVSQSTNLLKSIVWLIISFFLLVFTMYIFFKDGKKLVADAEHLLPLQKEYSHQLMQKFKQVSRAMLYGVFLTALVQGILGGIGLAIVGVTNPIFWGTAMGFLGMIPVFGTAIIWLPASLFLIFSGHPIAGIFLIFWGGVVVALIDNFVKPLVISKQADISPFATFLTVCGGLIVFGLIGAIVAPMILAATVTLMNLEKTLEGAQE